MWGKKAKDRAIRAQQALERIDSYVDQLQGIRGRFVDRGHALDIGPGDQSRLQQTVMELRDYFGLRQGLRHYGTEVVHIFIAGKENYLNSSSFNSVEECLATLRAARQRVIDDPGAAALRDPPRVVSNDGMATVDPEKVTIRWLIDKVPARMWAAAVGVLLTVFGGGFYAGSSVIVRTLLGLK